VSGITARCERAVWGELVLVLRCTYFSYICGSIFLWVSFGMAVYARGQCCSAFLTHPMNSDLVSVTRHVWVTYEMAPKLKGRNFCGGNMSVTANIAPRAPFFRKLNRPCLLKTGEGNDSVYSHSWIRNQPSSCYRHRRAIVITEPIRAPVSPP
jgi:hypothetical protein